MMSYGDNGDRAWVLDEQAAEPIVEAAADGGITFYDTADTYSGGASEVATGRLLGKLFDRDDVVVATKVYDVVDRVRGPLSAVCPPRRSRSPGCCTGPG